MFIIKCSPHLRWSKLLSEVMYEVKISRWEEEWEGREVGKVAGEKEGWVYGWMDRWKNKKERWKEGRGEKAGQTDGQIMRYQKIRILSTHKKWASYEYRYPFWSWQPCCVYKHPYKNRHPTWKGTHYCAISSTEWKWICWFGFSDVAANFLQYLSPIVSKLPIWDISQNLGKASW